MNSVNAHLGAAAKFIDSALRDTQAVHSVSLADANQRMDLVLELQLDLDEMARRTEFDLVRLIKKASEQ